MHVGSSIDRTALRWGFLDVSIGAQRTACGKQTPGAMFCFSEQTGIESGFVAVTCPQLGTIGRGAGRDDVDDAADGARSIQVAGTAADDFDAVNGELGLLLPMNPSADGVVEGHVVFSDQRAAGGGGTQAAQADALRGGIGHQRTGAAEQLDAGKLAQLIVHGDCGRIGERGLSEQARGCRAFQRAERRAIGGDGYLLGCGGEIEVDDLVLCQADCLLREPGRRNKNLAGIKALHIHLAGTIAASPQVAGGVRCRSSRQRSTVAISDRDGHGDCHILGGLCANSQRG